MSSGKESKKYSREFKQKSVETMRAEKLSYCETARRFKATGKTVCAWERTYLDEGAAGLYIDQTGRASVASGT